MDGMFGESVVGSVYCPQPPSKGWVMWPGNAEAWWARGRGWEMGIPRSQTTAHSEQSKFPEENLENSSAPSVLRPIALILFSWLCDVDGNNYFIWLLVLFWDYFFSVSVRPLIYLISIVLGSWPFLEYLLVILIFYIYIYVCVNIYIYIRNVLHLLTDKVVYIILTVNDLQRLLSKIFFHESFFPLPPNFFNIFGMASVSLGNFLVFQEELRRLNTRKVWSLWVNT